LKLDCSHCSQTPRANTPIRAATSQPCSASMTAVQPSGTHPELSVTVRNRGSARTAACSHSARALSVGQELEVGLFPLESNTKNQHTHSGCNKAALLNHHVHPSDTHPALSVPARNGASAKALPVLHARSQPPGLSSPPWDSTRVRWVITCAVRTQMPFPSPPPEGGRGRASRGQGLLGLKPRAICAGARDRGRGWALGVS
jgi:hypothetical protein